MHSSVEYDKYTGMRHSYSEISYIIITSNAGFDYIITFSRML